MTGRDEARVLIAWTVGLVIAAVAVTWALYLVRQVLVLIYVSALLAIGFSPLVRLIERQGVLQVGTRIPRWLAIPDRVPGDPRRARGRAFTVVPPFVSQARAFATHVPELFQRSQRWLTAHKILSQERSFGELSSRPPAAATSSGRSSPRSGDCSAACSGGERRDPHVLLVEARRPRDGPLAS